MPKIISSWLKRLIFILAGAFSVILLLGVPAVNFYEMFFSKQLAMNSEDKEFSEWFNELLKIYPDITQGAGSAGVFTFKDRQDKFICKAVETLPYTQNIKGFGGTIPMVIILDQSESITQIIFLKNSEDGNFWQRVIEAKLPDQFIGKSLSLAASTPVDAVSGATFSSNAVIQSIQATLSAVSANSNEELNTEKTIVPNNIILWNKMNIASLLIIFFAVITAFKYHNNKKLRTILLFFNVAVLGVWCGNFISLSAIIGRIAEGAFWGINFTTGILILSALIVPIFTGRNFYCYHLCPLGSAQELCGRISKKKVLLPPAIMKYLKYSRSIIFGIMIFCWSLGLGQIFLRFELFSAMLWPIMEITTLVILLLVLAVSVVIPRPYCRFFCPTGFLISYCTDLPNDKKQP